MKKCSSRILRIDAQKGLWIYWSYLIEEYLHLWQLPYTILVKLKKQKRSKNDTSWHRCHKSSSPGCRRCFLFSGWPCPCLRSDLPILGWSMQWSNPIAKTKLAFKDNDIGNPKTKTTNWSSTKAKQTWRRFLLWWTEVSSGNSTRRALSWFLYLVISYYLIGSTYYLVGGPQKSFLDLSPSLLTNGATMLENPRDKFKH